MTKKGKTDQQLPAQPPGLEKDDLASNEDKQSTSPGVVARLTNTQFGQALELRFAKEAAKEALDDAIQSLYVAYEKRKLELGNKEKIFWAQLHQEFNLDGSLRYGIDNENQTLVIIPKEE